MIAEPYRTWVDRWEKTLAAVRSVGGEAGDLVIKPPATEAEILGTERKIGRRLPPSFRRVLLEFSGGVSMDWYAAGPSETVADAIGRQLRQQFGLDPVDPRREVPSGEVGISLDRVEHADDVRRRRYKTLRRRGGGESETLALWARSSAWWALDDDVLVFADDSIVALERHAVDYPRWLAPDFIEFMERWTRIGCVSPHYLCYDRDGLVAGGETGLDPDCELAAAWRAAMDLDL